ncbi:PilZ domain-containing protein [Hydrogenophaga sp. OTU3427]|jgi:hypothetical protein|uniref:PilZ domain-containing protein n=1 Tax=Hydrogenophaga sp. OTU3427 TaxID=3043856 RepID=UPI00313F08CB
MRADQRSEPREPVSLPVTSGQGGLGVTRDISASGLFLQTDGLQVMGSLIELEIALDTPGGPMKLCATGEVVRVEVKDGKTGVGLKFVASRLEPG